MTKEQVAKILNGNIQRTKEFTECIDELRQPASEAGLVVVYMRSDELGDKVVFAGAINDQVGVTWALPEIVIYFTSEGLSENRCDLIYCPHFIEQQEKQGAVSIETVYEEACDANEVYWQFKTQIPHDFFLLYFDKAKKIVFCEGIVFSLNELKTQ